MAPIYFTQYLRPDGRKTTISIDRPAPVVMKADSIVSHGFRFECEMLHDTTISMTISDDHGDYAFKLCPNGPEVPQNVDDLILEFDVAKALKARKINQGR